MTSVLIDDATKEAKKTLIGHELSLWMMIVDWMEVLPAKKPLDVKVTLGFFR
jgi:hypothetical protein